MSRPAGELAGADPVSVGIAAKRIRQLRVHVGVAVLAVLLCVIALIGGIESVIALLVILGLTLAALIFDLRGWRGAGEIWAGRADPARMRTLSLGSLALGTPAFVATLIAAVLVVGLPLSRLVTLLVRQWQGNSSSWGLDAFGGVHWSDPVVVAAVVASIVASAAAATLSLRVGRRRSKRR